jgi:type IV pilus assembly protein PilN
MRLDINLASHPYEDARQFWMVWGTAVSLVAALTLVLLTLDVSGWIFARRDRHDMQQKRALIADRDRIRAEAQAFLNQPENRETRDKSQFLNELIERKAFSWTRVLENLEKVMPPHVHLVSITPKLTEDNELKLDMILAGDSRDRAIELTRRMEDSRRFAKTYTGRENKVDSQNGDTIQVEVVAIYVPEVWSADQTSVAKNVDGKKADDKAGLDGKSTGRSDAAKSGGTKSGAAKSNAAAKNKPGSKAKPSPQIEPAARRQP